MSKVPLGEIIAVRDLTYISGVGVAKAARVSIGKPVMGEDAHQWWCPYRIEAPDFSKEFRMAGGDSMQALILASQIIATELEALARDHGGRFEYFGERELGFPNINDKSSKY
jgi:hypothetical protein